MRSILAAVHRAAGLMVQLVGDYWMTMLSERFHISVNFFSNA
jgi:hypothetical protein